MRDFVQYIRDHRYGPVALAVLGGAIIGVGTDSVVIDEANRLEASLLSDVTEYYAEAAPMAEKPVVTAQKESVPRKAKTRTVRVLNEAKEALESAPEPAPTLSHDEQIRGALEALTADYELIITEVEREQRYVQELQNAYMSAIAAGENVDQIRAELAAFAPEMMTEEGVSPSASADEMPRG